MGTTWRTHRSWGGFVARAVDIAGLPPAELYKKLGLNYDTVTFRPDGESMFAVRYRSGGDVPLTGTFDEPVIPRQTHDHDAPPVPVGPLEAMADMPDSIYAIADDGARRVAIKQWIDGHHPEAEFNGSLALDLGPDGRPTGNTPRNPFRGNGFGGTGADFAPELTYGTRRIDIPQGAEMWRIRPDGGQELAAVFREGRWRPILGSAVGDST